LGFGLACVVFEVGQFLLALLDDGSVPLFGGLDGAQFFLECVQLGLFLRVGLLQLLQLYDFGFVLFAHFLVVDCVSDKFVHHGYDLFGGGSQEGHE
jgi:hypothetical protein